MKKILLLLLIASFFLVPQKVLAQNNVSQRKPIIVTVPSNQTINNDYYAYGDRIEVVGNITGDAYLAAGEIVVDGNINGDLIAVGGMIEINGKVGQDARLIAGQITVNGEIVKNLSYASGNFQTTKNSKIGNSVLAASGNSSYLGSVGKDIRIAAGNLNLNNSIGRDVSAASGNLRITGGTQIVGKLDYWSNPDASIDQSAKIGSVVKHQTQELPKVDTQKIAGTFAGLMVARKISSFLLALLIGYLLIKFVPNYMELSVKNLKNRLGGSMLWGLLYLIVTPVAIVLLLITIIGIPVSLMLIPLYFISIYFAKFFVASFIGRSIFKENKEVGFKEIAVGLLIIYLVTIVPFIGGIINFLILIAGLGTMLITKKEIFLQARDKKII